MDPLLPDFVPLEQKALAVIGGAAEIGRHLHPDTVKAVTELLRTINCYYSNLIEGHDTHPVEIERAMRRELSATPQIRDLQLEATAHIEVQRLIETRLAAEPELNVCGTEFLRWIHQEFYRRLPDELCVVRSPDGRREEPVIPGALRASDVKVGDHLAPAPEALEPLLARFADAYDPLRFRDRNGIDVHALPALAAAHHRLLWIHPFGDGNGRVTRLMTDAGLRRAGVGAHGLWTVSRGLARQRGRYKQVLANADLGPHHGADGRGPLSLRHLNAFCDFFLGVCDDQIAYMARMLAVDDLAHRFASYCLARESGAIRSPLPRATAASSRGVGRPSLGFRPESTRLLRTLLFQGALPRSRIEEATGVTERTAQRVVRSLIDEGFITSATSRAPLELRFPAHAAPYVFPGLYGPPDQSASGSA